MNGSAIVSAVNAQGVRKSFGETHALVDAHLDAAPGQIHAIVGENGSGKSTLAKIIAGVLPPDGGSIEVFGARPRDPAHAISLGVAMIYQEVMVADALSVSDNLFAGVNGFWRRVMTERERHVEAAALLGRLTGTAIDPRATAGDFPLGIKQWIVIGRALWARPKVLILDESSAALDLAATARLHAEIRRLRDEGSCVLIVTHRIAELVRFADRATVMRDGKTTGCLEKSEITEDRMLSLMSATSRMPRRSNSDSKPSAPQPQPRGASITVEKLQLEATSAAFSLTVHSGNIVGVCGLEGAGQDAFIRVLAGLTRPSAGTVTVSTPEGQALPVDTLSSAEAAGLVYVSGDRKKEGIFPNLSILENLAMPLYRRHSNAAGVIDSALIAQTFESEASRLGLKYGAAGEKITTLSGGNQQKVLIGRAFALQPRVILLNDPSRGVDIGTKQALQRHLREFAASGGAVVLLSSEIEEFYGFADRVDVFVGMSVFRSIDAADVCEETLLPALFGQSAPVDFEHALAGTVG